uniref:tRNA (guanine(26)-N(2))-dimethyltransferase n=1 Tax=Anopheles coluzzii TaxID=1518534 RepID=A0A8W7P8W1_ANOCL
MARAILFTCGAVRFAAKHRLARNLVPFPVKIHSRTLTTMAEGDIKTGSLKTIREGSAEILVAEHVFYNPVQEFNRDLSICVLTTFSRIYQREKSAERQRKNASDDATNGDDTKLEAGVKHENGLRILEALSATGLRSIRYAKEIPGVKEIIANDLSKSAVESIEQNVKHNQIEHLITPSYNDAMTLMYMSTKPEQRFTAIDLDPYGHPTRFLDGAVQSIEDGGLLLITATDMAVLAGNTPEACYVKYGSVPLKTKACHEMALRILLRCIETTATRYGRYMKPLLSISADFYIRVFVRIYTGQYACKKSSSKQSMVFQCTGCEALTLQPLGILKPNPTEANPQQIKFGIPTGPFVGSRCEHCNHQHHMGGPICRTSIKTDAPIGVLWDILRCWHRLHPVKADRFLEGVPLTAILRKEPAKVYNIDEIHPDANPPSRKESLSRFPENPAAHWGPGTRATQMVSDNKMLKSAQNQNKRKQKRTPKGDSADEESQNDVKADSESPERKVPKTITTDC